VPSNIKSPALYGALIIARDSEKSFVVTMAEKAERDGHYCNQVTELAKQRRINIEGIIKT
jgi:hypothetical protein